MSGELRIAAGVAFAMVIGLSLVAGQDVPPLSPWQTLEAAKAVEVEVWANREGIPNTTVSLTDLDGDRGIKRSITDSNGRVRFYDVPDGKYRLNISRPGIEDRRSVVFVAPGLRSFRDWLLVIDGRPVKQSKPCYWCGDSPMASVLLVHTTTSSLEDQLPPPLDSHYAH